MLHPAGAMNGLPVVVVRGVSAVSVSEGAASGGGGGFAVVEGAGGGATGGDGF